MIGLSAVVPPGGWPLSIQSQLRQLGGALRAMAVRPGALVKGTRYLFSMEAAHPKERLWYLLLLVVDPSAQRSGIGSRLQEDMLGAADADGLECYLETQKTENVAYYRRFGYDLDRTLEPVTGGPPLYLMRRAPKS
jgi:GNAT superfamily N-acetyltransferase